MLVDSLIEICGVNVGCLVSIRHKQRHIANFGFVSVEIQVYPQCY